MKIAIDIRALLDEQPGGIKTYTTEIVRAMVRVAPHHEYCLFYNSARPVSVGEWPAGVTVHGLRYPNKVFNTSQWALNWPRWERLVPADCYFAPALRLMPLAGDAPLVATVHDLSFAYFPEFYSLQRRVWHAMMRPGYLMRRADRLVCVSEATARDVVDYYGVRRERISVVRSGVDIYDRVSQEAIDKAKRKYRLPEQFVLFLATIEPRKNVPSVIRAFGAIAHRVPHDLVIAGERGWLTREVDEAYRVSQVADRIHWLGRVDERSKPAVLAAASLFVYPSFYEGFGFPPLEALLAGTPVVTSNNSSLPEIVGEWATLINAYDPAELAAVMEELLRDLPVVSDEVRQAIRERYSWDRAARETLAVMEGL